MKFNSYFIELDSQKDSVTGSLLIGGESVSANFIQIGPGLFVAYFKVQVGLRFQEKLELKGKSKSIRVLFPVLSKYNKRKLTRIAKILHQGGEIAANSLWLSFLTVEKIIRLQDLLDFFTLDREALVEELLVLEKEQQIKVIDFLYLTVTTEETFLSYLEEFHQLFNAYFVNRNRVVNLAEIEAEVNIPRSSLLFKYFLKSMHRDFTFKLLPDKIVFQKLAMTDREKEMMAEVETLLQKSRLSIFCIEDVLKLSALPQREINDSLWNMLDVEKLVQLNQRYFIFSDELNKIRNKLKKFKRNQGEMIDIQSFRDITLLTRKHIIPIFEYFDAENITQRLDNQRKILLTV